MTSASKVSAVTSTGLTAAAVTATRPARTRRAGRRAAAEAGAVAARLAHTADAAGVHAHAAAVTGTKAAIVTTVEGRGGEERHVVAKKHRGRVRGARARGGSTDACVDKQDGL